MDTFTCTRDEDFTLFHVLFVFLPQWQCSGLIPQESLVVVTENQELVSTSTVLSLNEYLYRGELSVDSVFREDKVREFGET